MSYVPPRATTIKPWTCEHPACSAVHLLLCDDLGRGIAQATASRTMVETWLSLINKKDPVDGPTTES